MQLSINVGSKINNEKQAVLKRNPLERIRNLLCHTSLGNLVTVVTILIAFLVALYVFKAYTSSTLVWLEKQDAIIIYVVIVILFTLVSFPISVGYIIIVIAAGYLYGAVIGLILSVIGANIGLIVAHNVMKSFGHHRSVRSFLTSDTAQAILKIISGPSSFKIIFCARLTPIPFGLQNGIFAFSNVSGRVYHVASILGLLPGQLVGIYVGSSLRSMQDVLDNRQINSFTYIFAASQLIFAAGLLVWLGSKARRELARAIAEADGKLIPSTGERFGGGASGFINIV